MAVIISDNDDTRDKWRDVKEAAAGAVFSVILFILIIFFLTLIGE